MLPDMASLSPPPSLLLADDPSSALNLSQMEDLMEDDPRDGRIAQGDPMLCSSPSSGLRLDGDEAQRAAIESMLSDEGAMLDLARGVVYFLYRISRFIYSLTIVSFAFQAAAPCSSTRRRWDCWAPPDCWDRGGREAAESPTASPTPTWNWAPERGTGRSSGRGLDVGRPRLSTFAAFL